MKKKAQVKFGETIGIIIIVYVVLMLGLLWYNDVNSDSLDELYTKDQKSRGFEKYYYITNNHMLREAQQGYIDEEFNLESIYAMSIFSQSKNGSDYLDKFLGYSSVSIKYYDINLENPRVIGIYSNYPGGVKVIIDEFTGYDLATSTRSISYCINELDLKVIGVFSEIPSCSERGNVEIFRTLIPIIDKSNEITLIGVLELVNYELER